LPAVTPTTAFGFAAALVDAEAIPNPVPADMATATVTAAVIEAQRAIRIETPSLWLVEGSDRKI
jgi:hypothetical protein